MLWIKRVFRGYCLPLKWLHISLLHMPLFLLICECQQQKHGETPHCRKSTPLILTRHLYHHTPLVEYIMKHLYMYPRTLLFGSWDITQTYHHPYAYICMHMHTYAYTCMQMHADARPLPHPRLTLHAYVCICIHKCAYACRCVHMHTHWRPTPWIPSICMHEREDRCIPVHVHADGWLLQSFSLQFNVVWVVRDGVSPGTFRGWRACVGTTLLIHLDDSLLY